MTFSKIGRIVTALVASAALGLGMTACGGGTIGYMWILGTQYNQITGYKIDDFTGNLTQMDHSPYASGGSNPQMLVVKPGGRYVYVINSGVGEVGTPNTGSAYKPGTGTTITEFSVGGGGVLTFQQNYSSQGYHPVYLTFDGSGSFLYVLDKYSQNYCAQAPCTKSTDGSTLTGQNLHGSITAFSVAADTGRLTLVPNTTVLIPPGQIGAGTPTTFFEVDQNPIMTKVGSGSCLYTLSPHSVYPYVITSGNGQLTTTTTGSQGIQSSQAGLTSINTSQNSSASSYVYMTDGGANMIYSFQTGATNCSLSPIPTSQTANVVPNVIPVNSLTTNNGMFLYVLNQTIPSTTATEGSSISGFLIQNGVLTSMPETTNPFATGSGPMCLVEDPSSQYVYTSNNIDSTVTGKQLQTTRGTLADLSHGSSFPVTGNPTCLAVSGNI